MGGAELMTFVSLVTILVEIVMLMIYSVIGLAQYVLQGVAMFKIAKRRQLPKPWLAFIPYANTYMLGAIADQYQSIAKGKETKKRKTLLGWRIAMTGLLLLYFVFCFVMTLNMANDVMQLPTEMEFQNYMFRYILIVCGACIPVVILAVINVVLTYKATYDLYRSSRPKNSKLFLILSIVGEQLLSLPMSTVFMLVCMNKDEGMIPVAQTE